MSSSIKCPKCGREVVVPDGTGGGPIACPGCGTVCSPPAAAGEPLGPRDFGQVIGDMFSLYFKNFWTVIGISVLGYLPMLVIMGLIVLAYVFGVGVAAVSELRQYAYLLIIIIPILLVFMLLASAASILKDGALIFATAEQFLRPPEVFRSFKPAFSRFWNMVGAGLLIALAVLGLCITIIGIPFAIYFAITWSFTMPAIIVEGRSITDAMHRSRQLIKDNFWRVCGIGFIVMLIVSGIAFAAGSVPFLNFIVTPLIQPLSLITVMLLYFDLRVRKEGYTPEKLSAELERLVLTTVTPESHNA